MKYIFPLNAIHNDGYTELLYNLGDVEDFIKTYGRWTKRHWNSYDLDFYFHGCDYSQSNWIVRDDWGREVDVRDFISTKRWSRYYENRLKEISRASELGLPIPGTRKRSYHRNYSRKKNGGKGARNRARAKAIYEEKEYGIAKKKLKKVIPWE